MRRLPLYAPVEQTDASIVLGSAVAKPFVATPPSSGISYIGHRTHLLCIRPVAATLLADAAPGCSDEAFACQGRLRYGELTPMNRSDVIEPENKSRGATPLP